MLAFTLLAFFLFTRESHPDSGHQPVRGRRRSPSGFHLFPYTGPQGAIAARRSSRRFGHEALVAICSLMILGRALMVTGALEPVASVLARLWAFNRLVALFALLAVAMGLSMVINDTPVVVILMPVVIGLALRAGGSASKMLMPMNFAVIIGGMATTIGTSTNLLIVSIANDHRCAPDRHVRVHADWSSARRCSRCCISGSSRRACCSSASTRSRSFRRDGSTPCCTSAPAAPRVGRTAQAACGA